MTQTDKEKLEAIKKIFDTYDDLGLEDSVLDMGHLIENIRKVLK